MARDNHEEIDALIVDVSVYGSAADMPPEIWPTEAQVSTKKVLELYNLMQARRANEQIAAGIPGIAPPELIV